MAGIAILDREPEEFFQGETIKWEKSLSDYPFSEGWTLKYYFSKSDDAFNVTAAQSGTSEDYLVTLLSSVTADKVIGIYDWQAWVEKDTEKDMVGTGTTELKSTLTGGGNVDSRTHVKKTLDALEATILKKASRDQLDTEIVGRKIKTFTPEELLEWRSKYRDEYQQEEAAKKVAEQLGTGSRIGVRFSD